MLQNLTVSTPLAITFALLSAFFWGSWTIIFKENKDILDEALYLIIFTTSALFVWVAGFALDGAGLLSGIKAVWKENHIRIVFTFLAGLVYIWTTLMSIKVMQRVGLSLAQPVNGSISLSVGTAASYLIGGVPAGIQAGRLIIAGLFLTAAIFLTSFAANTRSKAQLEQSGLEKLSLPIFLMSLIGGLTGVIYSTAISFGMKSVSQPHGLTAMGFLAVLLSGAWLGALILCGIPLTKKKQWGVFKSLKPKAYAMIAAASSLHYLGNILHAFATKTISAAVAWPLSMTSGLWTQFWGLAYGEFKGAPRKAYWLLGSGVFCYIIGAFVLTNLL